MNISSVIMIKLWQNLPLQQILYGRLRISDRGTLEIAMKDNFQFRLFRAYLSSGPIHTLSMIFLCSLGSVQLLLFEKDKGFVRMYRAIWWYNLGLNDKLWFSGENCLGR